MICYQSNASGANIARDELNWNLLRTFFAIAEERSITLAARRLGIRQPSVSNALQKLESQLGCKLVFRDSRHFELTTSGEKVYQECKEIFHSAQRISDLTETSPEDERGEVKFQIVSNLTSPFIDELLRLYHQRYPSVTFLAEVKNSQNIIQNILQQHLNIGFCLLSKPVINLPSMRLFRDEFRVFCGAEHPYFGRETVGVKDLRQQSFISFTCATEGMGLEPMMLLRENANLGNRIAGSSPNFEEVRRMIVAGIGIGILPVLSVTDDIEKGVLWPLEITDQPIGTDAYLVHADTASLSSAERNFIDLAQELVTLYPDMV